MHGKANRKASRKEAKKSNRKVKLPFFEYQWPPSSGNYYALQSLLSRFLDEPTFHQRYLSLNRRRIGLKERQHLREIGLLDNKPLAKIVAIQCNFKLIEVMQNEYPDRYREYAKSSKIAAPMSSSRAAEKPRRQTSSANNLSNLSKQQVIFNEAVYHAAEFNSQLAKERREERGCYFDIQTQRVHVPANTTLRLHPDYTRKGGYPVAILSGQYSDSFYRYTPEQLKAMPVKTVLKLPFDPNTNSHPDHNSTESNHEEDSNQTFSAASNYSNKTMDSDRSRNQPQELIHTPLKTSQNGLSRNSSSDHIGNARGKLAANKTVSTNSCGVCFASEYVNDLGEIEELIKCSQCGSLTHPTCLELTPEMVKVIQTYHWQCMDCKTCTACSDPYDEDKMMFCDRCDRGYHTFCVGLDSIPSGNWICPSCTQHSGNKNANSYQMAPSKKRK
ncbi:uncharacterized protein TRIADDRAFT_26973 [Trichoplax adhaerens]|uniref:PHD finger protein 10 n=1 Tax=Trichoplax adhaerens TaxID=10228 RepID=B3RZP6_TRIAD|nr:hypothetical protein TRIADDRAFT_26973 [Trichoplax adhaerens]EDV24241.1 hypothetical protein TRIADDRAFT_26973 [Trichoplax adhaerens]|eukprot:XP_002113767.1 hypothetical protein TRIADDRAFT_26973 [Trichoplax adhaerens]